MSRRGRSVGSGGAFKRRDSLALTRRGKGMQDINTDCPVGSIWEYTGPQRPLVIFHLGQLFASSEAESVWSTDLLDTPNPLLPEVNAIAISTEEDGWSADVTGTVTGHHCWHGKTDVVLLLKTRLAYRYWTRQQIVIQLHVSVEELHRDWERLS